MEGMFCLSLCLVMMAYTQSHVVMSSRSIFLLAGQSNMAGEGGVSGSMNKTWDGIVPPECEPNPRILRLNANLSWEEAREPLHRDVKGNGVCGIGPGMAFANSVLKRDPYVKEIGLVPCAVGGSYITGWSRGNDLYNTLLTRAQASLVEGGVIEAILWYQGESDCNDPYNAEQYKSRFEQFIADVRSDLLLPTLPVIEVAITSGGRPEFREILRKGQLEVPSEVHNVICVDAKGLQIGPDNLHLTTRAQVQLGQMLAHDFRFAD